jgi:hypothetical protein
MRDVITISSFLSNILYNFNNYLCRSTPFTGRERKIAFSCFIQTVTHRIVLLLQLQEILCKILFNLFDIQYSSAALDQTTFKKLCIEGGEGRGEKGEEQEGER